MNFKFNENRTNIAHTVISCEPCSMPAVICVFARSNGLLLQETERDRAWATSDLTGHPWTKKRIPIGSMLTGAFVDRVIVLSTGSRRHMI